MDVKKVIVLGGGTSGWLSAIFFKKVWPSLDITVIEDPTIPPIIAGESCTAPFVDLIDFLSVDINDWIKKVDAFPKLGGKFEGWTTNGTDFVQPLFSNYRNRWDFYNAEFGNNNVLLKALLAANLPLDKITISGNLLENKLTPYTSTGAVVKPMYHFDSRKNAEYFKNIGMSMDINLILSKYQSSVLKDDSIEKLILDDQEISGDFFIDCSGFNRLLLKKTLNVGFEDFSKYLPASSVIAWWDDTELKPYTKFIAMDYGWRFNIDLQSRSGNGYVYDGSLITADEAQKEVEAKIKKPIELVAKASWKPEMAMQPWCQNVIAVGLSSGFLEPLGSNGHTMIAMTLRLLSEQWNPCKETHNFSRKHFNSQYKKIIDDTVDFISLHYRSGRKDTEFWQKHLSLDIIPDSLKDKLERYKCGNFYDDGTAYSLENYCVVVQAYNLLDKDLLAKSLCYKDKNILAKITEEFNQLRKEIGYISRDCVSTLDWKKLV